MGRGREGQSQWGKSQALEPSQRHVESGFRDERLNRYERDPETGSFFAARSFLRDGSFQSCAQVAKLQWNLNSLFFGSNGIHMDILPSTVTTRLRCGESGILSHLRATGDAKEPNGQPASCHGKILREKNGEFTKIMRKSHDFVGKNACMSEVFDIL